MRCLAPILAQVDGVDRFVSVCQKRGDSAFYRSLTKEAGILQCHPGFAMSPRSFKAFDCCEELWQSHHQLLMRQAPEMGIALLNFDYTSPPLIFADGCWEKSLTGQTVSFIAGRDVVAKRAEMIDSKSKALVIWGLGLGYWYLYLRAWLRQDPARQLIFCESRVSDASHFLHMPWAKELLSDPQVHVRAHFSGEKERGSLREIAWLCMLLPLEFALNEYAQEQGDYELKRVPLAEQMVLGALGQFDQLAGEVMRFSKPFYINFYLNTLRRSEDFNLHFMQGAFEDLKALVCGAGPSLKEQKDDLRALSDRVLLLAGGSAVNALTTSGPQPHFGFAIDPNPLQEQRIRANIGYHLPYFYRRRFCAEGLDAVCGPRILVNGAAGYPLVKWLDEQRQMGGDEELIEEGHNVLHFAIDTARFLGLKDLVLCGMDLAYERNEGYAPGVLNGHVGMQTAAGLCCDEPIIEFKSDRGKIVQTHWKWVEESKWIGEYIARGQRPRIRNATPEGLGIQGVPRDQLSKSFPLSSTPSRDLSGRVWLEMQRARASQVACEKKEKDVKKLFSPIWASFARIEKLLRSFCATYKPIILASAFEDLPVERGELVFAEVTEELAYQLILCFADQMHNVILERSLRGFGGNSGPSENWPAKTRWILLLQRAEELLSGCALHSQWWKNAEEITSGKVKRQASVASSEKETKGMADRALCEQLMKLKKGSSFGDKVAISEPRLGVKIEAVASNDLISTVQKKLEVAKGSVKAQDHRLCKHLNDQRVLQELWLEKNKLRDGQSLLLYPDGSIKGEAFYKENQLHGPARYFLPNKTLTSEVWFIHGLRQGYQRQFYSDGSLYSLGGYREGRRFGFHWSFHPDGGLKSKVFYRDEAIDGLVQIFHCNGQLARRTRFCNGLRDGWDRHWSKEGNRSFEARYIMGKPTGTARRWHSNGQLAERMKYFEPGGRVETIQFSNLGVKISQGKYLDSVHYDICHWNERGDLIEKKRLKWQEGALRSI